MALIANIGAKYNYTRTNIDDAYFRVDEITLHLKAGIIRFTLGGFISKESGQMEREHESDLQQHFSNLFTSPVTTLEDNTETQHPKQASVVMTNALGNEQTIYPSPFVPLIRSVKIFDEMYSVKLTEPYPQTKSAALILAYEAVKQIEYRLENIKDDL